MKKKDTLFINNLFMILTLFLATASYAQNQSAMEIFLTEYRWSSTPTWIVHIITSILIITPIVILLIHIFQKKSQKNQTEKYTSQLFSQKAQELKLLVFEQTLLRSITWDVAPQMPLEVFKSLIVFENAVDIKIKKILKKYGENSKTMEDTVLVISNLRRKLGFDKVIPERQIQSTRNIERDQIISLSDASNGKNICKAKIFEITELYFVARLIDFDNSVLAEEKCPEGIMISLTRVQDAIYSAHLVIRALDTEEKTISLYHTVALERSQSRKYARITMDNNGLQCQCKILERKDGNATPAPGEFLPDTFISDISGGGLAFFAKSSLSQDDIVMFTFNLQEQKFSIKGKIVAISAQEGTRNTYYKHRIVFCGIKPSDIEKIIKFVYKKQQEKLQLK